MARFAVNLPSGRTDHEGFLRLIGKTLTGSGVLGTGDLAVSAQPTPDMSVRVAAGDVAIFSGAILYHGWSTAVENVTIPTNSSGVTKITAVVASINLAGAVDDPNNPNNPNALVFQTFTLEGTDTSTPTDAQISTGIGGRPFHRLANVTVGNGVTSINAGNIADTRVVTAANRVGTGVVTNENLAGGITLNKVASEAWSSYAVAWSGSGGTQPSIGNGTLTGRYQKNGRAVHLQIYLAFGSTTTAGDGVFRFSLPVAAATSLIVYTGIAHGLDGGAQRYAGAFLVQTELSTNYGIIVAGGEGTGAVNDWSNSVPFAWGSGDRLSIGLTYEAAS